METKKGGDREGKRVIVDTNALLIPGEFGVDIFLELERLGYVRVIVPKMVLDELDGLRSRLKGKEKMAAEVAHSLVLKYASLQKHASLRCKVTIDEEAGGEGEEERSIDDMIAELALKKKAAVLTNDEDLRKKLSKIGIMVVYLRGRNRLKESGG
jgi:hypothetical protein